MLLSRSNSSVDAATVEAVWRVTLDEVSRGWLEGPLTEAEVQAKFGTLFVASPRFGLHQSDKVRPIDDMSVSLVNCSFAAQYRLEMDGVDSISVLARTFLEAVKDTGTVEVPLSTGCVLKAPLHRSLTVPEARRLMGRTLDLDSAYKQLLVKRSSLWCSVLLVPDAQGAKHYFVSRVMPFGAASAVYAFNKISRSIFKVGSKLFGLIWSNYYDDYPQLDLQSAGRSSQNVAETFLELIGWRYSTKPAKRLPMARTFQALGVEYSFEESLQGTIVVRNKPSRVERIVADIDLLLSKGSFTSAEASSLRGRLQFAESQTFGRVLALRMKMCNLRAAGSLPGNFINEAIRAELEWARSFVSSSPPRLLQAGVAKQTFLIFTDAALEGNDRDGSVGMVAYRLQNQEIVEKWFFSEQVPKDTMRLSDLTLECSMFLWICRVAWIRNATLKDNIIFNSRFDEDRYHAVLKACCLLPDLETLPNGDLTEIGEKGVNLSGGQKQRISLARAVYSQADLMLLDDPLSAVDSHVARTLLKMFQSPLLAKSSIVLCTHHIHAVNSADQIILLARGKREDEESVANGRVEDGEPGEQDDELLLQAAASAQGPAAQVTFCGSLNEFREKFPKLAAGSSEKAFERQLSRQISHEETLPVAAKDKETGPGQLVQKEEEQVGSVPADVYGAYIQAAGGWCLAVTVLIGVLCGQGLQALSGGWISYWSDHSKPDNPHHISSQVGLIGYASLSLAAFCGIFLTSALFRLTALKAARSFHRKLLSTVLRLPMTFFDTTPLGRVLNRFSKDIYTIDEVLQNILYSYLQVVSVVVCTMIVISAATPWFLVVIFPLLLVYRATQNFYIPASRQLKRIESNLRSPIFSHFSETLDGTALIRAFGQQQIFISENMGKVSKNMRAYYSNFSSNRWLAVRLESFGAGITFCAGTLAVVGRHQISAGVAGLSISYALSITQALNWVVRMAADRETSIVSVERVREYLRLELEPPHHCENDPAPNSWPTSGSIEFQ
ncbi:ATP-binding cassette sub-family C member 3 (Canalicular multispecific organic anion transporter 2) (Multidrug resistance-associated protein 3), partial [Durusdinium trenchii]